MKERKRGRIERELEAIELDLKSAERARSDLLAEIESDYESIAYGHSSMANIGGPHGKGGIPADRVGDAVIKLQERKRREMGVKLAALNNKVRQYRDCAEFYGYFLQNLTPIEKLAYDLFKIVPNEALKDKAYAAIGRPPCPNTLGAAYCRAMDKRDAWVLDMPIEMPDPV